MLGPCALFHYHFTLTTLLLIRLLLQLTSLRRPAATSSTRLLRLQRRRDRVA